MKSNEKKPQPLRAILLTFALLTSPLLCCGGIQLLDAIPESVLPSGLDFTLNLFEAEARVENKTAETFYITAITTTYGYPAIIPQNISLGQRDIPVEPNSSVALKYDAADSPLSGIAVCRTDTDCRLLTVENSGAYVLEAYEDLPALEAGWLAAIQSSPRYNYTAIVIPILSLLPILLFLSWLYLGRAEKKQLE